MELKTVVYTSDKKTHFFKELREIFKDIRSSHFLAYQMTKRDIQAQYRQSYLGVFWAFAPIIINSLVWLFLNGSGVVAISGITIPYPVYVIVGTIFWSVFSDTAQTPILSVNGGKGLMSKINFPREALIMSGLYNIFFNLALKLILIVIVLVVFGINPGINVIFFSFYFVCMFTFALSLGLLITPIGLIYTDIARIVNTGISFLMYITPVVYAIPQHGIFRQLFQLNPLTYLVTDGRNSLTGQPLLYLLPCSIIFVISIVLLCIGLVIFRKSMPIIIEKISG